jgi:transposase
LGVSDVLPDDAEMLKAILLVERCERLRQIIKELQRHRFGRRPLRFANSTLHLLII